MYADGERCGKTIVDLFANAKDPDSIVVGIIDQSFEEDIYCLESYCKEMGKWFVLCTWLCVYTTRGS